MGLKSSDRSVVISLCDYTGVMVRPWADAGYRCICVDTQHPMRSDRVEGNITYTWGDVRSWCLPEDTEVAILFAFPPCTDVAVSGARDFRKKRNVLLRDALELFAACEQVASFCGAPYMIENPVGKFSSHMGSPTHTFDPCDYAGYDGGENDLYTKKTCLWTGGGFAMPEPKRREPTQGSIVTYGKISSPSPERQNLRSATPAGFAQAVFEANAVCEEAGWEIV
jgi:hypothetical protein